MINKKKYFEKFVYNERSDINYIENLLKKVGINKSSEYIDIMFECNGGHGSVGKSYLDLWSAEEVNDFYEDSLEHGLENFILFASDGCGNGFAFYKCTNKVAIIPMDSLEDEYAEICADDFQEFIEKLYEGYIEY